MPRATATISGRSCRAPTRRCGMYPPDGPFTERAAFDAWLAGHADSRDPQFYAVVEQTDGRALGLLAYLRITPEDGCIEIGHIAFGAALQRTPGASEAVFLLARHAFDARATAASSGSATRATPAPRAPPNVSASATKGCSAQHMMVKGENRDTAWYALIAG